MSRLLAFAAVLALGVSFNSTVGTQPGPPLRPAVRAGSLLYLSGTLPTGTDGKIVTGDVRLQTRQVLANLKRVLGANGSRVEKVAAVTVYLTRRDDFAAMNEVYRTFWDADPPARTTVVAGLMAPPEALVEISMIAGIGDAERRVVRPPDWIAPQNPYSYAVRCGDTLFLSGLVPRNGKDNSPVIGDITVQTNAVMKNAGDILKAAGMDYRDVVSARVFLSDAAMFEPMNAVYRPYFPKDPPARATVRAGLTSPGDLVEIAFTAVASKDRQAFTTPNADGTPGRTNPNLSAAIRVGDRLFLSGMVGNTATTTGDVPAQTREALARVGRTLKAAGFQWSQVADSTVYLTEPRPFGEMNEVYRQVLGKEFPARATTAVGLMGPTALVEIMMTAAKN